ncbi:O-antigen ligase family protein [Modestobacter sp. NPDC049651]|uniref:O-antigen ligase family protein n=1 Tax=unclassified Modestobacter TaxID=2643866 RepID=UPI0033CE2D44
MTSAPGPRPDGRYRSGSAIGLLLATAFVLSQWSEFLVARWLLRALPFAVLLAVLALPSVQRARLRLPVPLAAFVLWCLVSVAWSADRGSSALRLVDLLALVTVGWIGGQVCGARAPLVLARTVQCVLLVTVATLVVAPGWATAAGLDGAPGWHGAFPHKNDLGFFCALAVVTLWTQLPRGWARRGWLVLAAVLLLGSASASALAATAVAVAVITWATARDRRPPGRDRLLVDSAAAAVVGLVGALAVLRPGLFFGALGRDSSLTGRRAIWAAVRHHLHDHPLVGFGFGGVWERPTPVTLALWRESRFEAFYAHNGWLDIRLQVGWVGLALLVLLLGGVAVRAAVRGGPVGAWSMGVLVLLCVTALTESSPFTGNGLLLLAALSGCLSSGSRTPPARPARREPEQVRPEEVLV